MPDLLIAEQLRLALSQAFDLMQWWASISFGLLALIHFLRKQLNIAFVVLLFVLYAAFTYWSYVNIMLFVNEQIGYRNDLVELMNSGQVTQGTLAHLEYLRGGTLRRITFAFNVCFVGMYFGVSFYLVYSYWRGRHERGAA